MQDKAQSTSRTEANRLTELHELATNFFADEARALAWLQENAHGLNGKRPLDMVSSEDDFLAVKNFIDQLEHEA